MQSAFDELAGLGAGVQLTPGNHPTAKFEEHTGQSAQPTRTHHGFAYRSRKRAVWSDDARCLVDAHSVHPPMSESPAAAAVRELGLDAWLTTHDSTAVLLETMYPGYVLGSGEEIERAMELGVWLAVDVSHVFMQRQQGVMSEETWKKLASYDRIGEVHVSANNGRQDLHSPMTEATFGLGWARERMRSGTPVVLECYMHRLSPEERRQQMRMVEERRS